MKRNRNEKIRSLNHPSEVRSRNQSEAAFIVLGNKIKEIFESINERRNIWYRHLIGLRQGLGLKRINRTLEKGSTSDNPTKQGQGNRGRDCVYHWTIQ